MPGLRFLSLPEMQQNTFSKSEKRTCQSGKSTAARRLRKFSKRPRLGSEPSTPANKPVQKSSRRIPTLPGSLIHLSQSADGKLRWDPPSSSTSSLSDSRVQAGFISAECGPTSTVRPALMKSIQKPLTDGNEEPLKAVATSPRSTSCLNCIMSDSSIINSAAPIEESDMQEVSFGSHQQASSSSSELSVLFQQHSTESKRVLCAGVQGPLSFRTCGLSPYLSSKLKPGKHILGVKRHQNFIRPGQLRHWAVGNSPSLNFANLPAASLKGKACRTLAF